MTAYEEKLTPASEFLISFRWVVLEMKKKNQVNLQTEEEAGNWYSETRIWSNFSEYILHFVRLQVNAQLTQLNNFS